MRENEAKQEQSPSSEQKSDSASGSEKKLMRSLMRELFQTEHSAQTHCRAEAERLPGTPPEHALLATARHADSVLEELPIRAKHHDLPVSPIGVSVGEAFSRIRRHVTDLLMDSETSYRATLLGLRHGVDVWRLLREAALAAKDDDLAAWCDRVYLARVPLIEECAQQLSWFAQHPDEATSSVPGSVLKKGLAILMAPFKRFPAAKTAETAGKPA
jgi:hypothetical protein